MILLTFLITMLLLSLWLVLYSFNAVMTVHRSTVAVPSVIVGVMGIVLFSTLLYISLRNWPILP